MFKKILLTVGLLACLAGQAKATSGYRTDLFETHNHDGDQVRISSEAAIIQTGTVGQNNKLETTDITGNLSLTGTMTNTTRGLMVVHETFIDPIAVDSNTYLNKMDVSTATLGALTTSYYASNLLLQPYLPRNVSFFMTDSAGDSTGTVTFYGKTANGDVVSDALAFNGSTAGKTVVSNYAFLTISTITLTYSAYGANNSELFWVGVSSGIGLANDTNATSDLIQASENGTATTSGTLSPTYDTYLPAAAPDGSKDYVIYYKATSTP